MSQRKNSAPGKHRSEPPETRAIPALAERSESQEPITFEQYVVAARQLDAMPQAERQQSWEACRGKRVRWEAWAQKVECFSESDRLALVVTPGRSEKKTLRAVCFFPAEMKQRLSTSLNRTVRVSGIVQDQDESHVYLKHCELDETARPVRSQRASSPRKRAPKPRRRGRGGLLGRIWKITLDLARAN